MHARIDGDDEQTCLIQTETGKRCPGGVGIQDSNKENEKTKKRSQ